MRKETPSEYLEKYQQKSPDEETQRRIDGLFVPWGTVEYKDWGSEEIEHGAFQIAFDFRPVPKEVSSTFVENGQADENYFELTDFLIRRKDKHIERTMKRVLPDDFHVYFTPSKGSETCYVVPEAKRIVLHGDPSSPRIFLALFHEVGHIYEQQQEKSFAPEDFSDRRVVDVKDIATTMHSERDAWAFALRYLRPLFDRPADDASGLSSDDVLAYAKNVALHSYSEGSKYDVALERSMASFAWDYADDNRYPDYWDDPEESKEN